MYKLPEDIWWNEISGPVRFLQAIKDGVLDRKCVLIVMPNDMPWRKEMRDNLELPGGFVRNDIDIEDKWGDNDDIAERIRRYIIDNNTPITGYRDKFFSYYEKNCRNRESVFWLKGISNKNRDACISFLIEYAAKTKGKDLPPIVMEVRENKVAVSKSNMLVIEWRDYVTSFDSRLFAYMIVSQELLPLQKKYLAEVCTSLFAWDAEICARTITAYTEGILKGEWEKVFNPLDTEYDKRGQDNAHFLYLYRNDGKEDIHKRIWEAQLKTFFPLVEERRLFFVNKYERFFRTSIASLDLRDKITDEPISEPYDLEIGQLLYCMNNSTSEVTNVDSKELYFLRKVRNALAHLEILDGQTIEDLIRITNQ